MKADLVWNTWRRVLRDDGLVAWIMQPDARSGAPDGLSADQRAIIAAYASTPEATDSNIGMYRRGLVRNALGALDLVPLTRRLLRLSGRDTEVVAADFVKSTGYPDDGPYFWRAAARFVAYLARLPEFASRAHQDVLAIDAATVALARKLGQSPPAVWPADAAARHAAVRPRNQAETARIGRNPAAVTVASACDLTSWIEAPFDFDPVTELEVSPRHWLVYFPAAELAHEYAELSERGARAFNLLETPKTVGALVREMSDLSQTDVEAAVGSLLELGVLVSGTDLSALTATSVNVLTMEGTSGRASHLRAGPARSSHETT